MTLQDALDQLHGAGDPERARQMAAYHKIDRPYIGLANPVVDAMCKDWRRELDVDQRVELAAGLWRTDIYEARLAAAKLLTQARIRPDQAAWELIASWVPDFDSWALADHACTAGQKRLVAEPARLDLVESWTGSDHMWTKRAALVITLPWTKQNHPKPHEVQARERVLGWAAAYVEDGEWFIQKAVAWWLRELSKHDERRVVAFLDAHGARMKNFARKEAGKYLNR